LILDGEVQDSTGGTTLLSLSDQSITLPAGASDTVRMTTPWNEPVLWSPDQPTLLRLHSRIHDGTAIVDEETRRFGFREIWIEGNRYFLNGVRINLIGTSLNWHSQFIKNQRYARMYPDTWKSTIGLYKDVLHHNVLRLHMEPAPDWMLDVADRKGMIM